MKKVFLFYWMNEIKKKLTQNNNNLLIQNSNIDHVASGYFLLFDHIIIIRNQFVCNANFNKLAI